MRANVLKVQKLKGSALLPKRATSGAAGVDLAACIDEPIVIKPGEIVKVPTGIAIAAPSAGYAALLFARSGLACEHGIALANGVGVVDSDYRGEIIVALINQGTESYAINPKDRIAQLVLTQISFMPVVEVTTLQETSRGTGGFGSTDTE